MNEEEKVRDSILRVLMILEVLTNKITELDVRLTKLENGK